MRRRHPDGVDAVIDIVNYEPGAYDAALKPGGRIASSTGAAGEGPGRTDVMAEPSPKNLQRLAGLLADRTLRIPVQATYELAGAPEVLAALSGAHTQGKLAVRWADAPRGYCLGREAALRSQHNVGGTQLLAGLRCVTIYRVSS